MLLLKCMCILPMAQFKGVSRNPDPLAPRKMGEFDTDSYKMIANPPVPGRNNEIKLP